MQLQAYLHSNMKNMTVLIRNILFISPPQNKSDTTNSTRALYNHAKYIDNKKTNLIFYDIFFVYCNF